MPSETGTFLEGLFAGKPDDLYVLLWTLPEKRSHWFLNVEGAIQFAESNAARDLYVGVGLSAHDYGPKRRCSSEDAVGVVGVCADLDLRSDAHPKLTLPETLDQARSILPPEFPPTFVVLTGNGLQVWWLFREPYLFDSDDDRRAATALVNRWHTLLHGNAGWRGWTYDRLADLARVLRVPGTTNCKDPSNPKPVVIESRSDRRYDPSELAEHLDDLAVSDPAAEAAAAQEWALRFHDTPLTINLSVRIPEDGINRWLAADQRFKDTWFRQRLDLRDQSQSGYDLALACFGFGAGLTEQDIVDLIVHHRALHKQKQRTRLDYFQRTLSKAASRTDAIDNLGSLQRPKSAAAGLSAPNRSFNSTPNPDVTLDKAAICQNLSRILGVEIHSITKINGQSPIFHMDLAGIKIEFSHIGKLISQPSVRNTLAATTGKLIRHFKTAEWGKVAQALLDACTVEEGGEEMEMEGSARLRLNQYLSAMMFIDSLDGQTRDNARKPMIADEFITVCASDIQTYLNKTTGDKVTTQAVVGMLSAVGAKSKRFRGKFPEQSRWLLPPDKFAPADYAVSREQEPVDDRQ